MHQLDCQLKTGPRKGLPSPPASIPFRRLLESSQRRGRQSPKKSGSWRAPWVPLPARRTLDPRDSPSAGLAELQLDHRGLRVEADRVRRHGAGLRVEVLEVQNRSPVSESSPAGSNRLRSVPTPSTPSPAASLPDVSPPSYRPAAHCKWWLTLTHRHHRRRGVQADAAGSDRGVTTVSDRRVELSGKWKPEGDE
jgi:hypothetical protein